MHPPFKEKERDREGQSHGTKPQSCSPRKFGNFGPDFFSLFLPHSLSPHYENKDYLKFANCYMDFSVTLLKTQRRQSGTTGSPSQGGMPHQQWEQQAHGHTVA